METCNQQRRRARLSARTPKNNDAGAEQWSARAIKSFVLTELEARKLKYPDIATESLLMRILVEGLFLRRLTKLIFWMIFVTLGTSMTAMFLHYHVITFFKVQQETVDLLGKAKVAYFSPEHPPLTEPAQKAIDWAIDMKLRSEGRATRSSSHRHLTRDLHV
ncbi:hypothetical protein Dimus_018059 [Dionaea muscipula]